MFNKKYMKITIHCPFLFFFCRALFCKTGVYFSGGKDLSFLQLDWGNLKLPCHLLGHVCHGQKSLYWGWETSHLKNMNPYNGYKPLLLGWWPSHPLLYGNNGSLDPGTCDNCCCISFTPHKTREARTWKWRVPAKGDSEIRNHNFLGSNSVSFLGV